MWRPVVVVVVVVVVLLLLLLLLLLHPQLLHHPHHYFHLRFRDHYSIHISFFCGEGRMTGRYSVITIYLFPCRAIKRGDADNGWAIFFSQDDSMG